MNWGSRSAGFLGFFQRRIWREAEAREPSRAWLLVSELGRKRLWKRYNVSVGIPACHLCSFSFFLFMHIPLSTGPKRKESIKVILGKRSKTCCTFCRTPVLIEIILSEKVKLSMASCGCIDVFCFPFQNLPEINRIMRSFQLIFINFINLFY